MVLNSECTVNASLAVLAELFDTRLRIATRDASGKDALCNFYIYEKIASS